MPPVRRPIACITGASGGIGEEFARLLAAEGHDLILVARSEEKLARLKVDLEQAHLITCHIMTADLAAPGAAAKLVGEMEQRGLASDVLINNAGFGTYGPFLDIDLAPQRGMLDLNIVALTELTHLLARGMKSRGTGRILNVASTAAFQPMPIMAVYAATKAFVLSLSEALANELAGTGVTVTCLCPGPTATGFQDRAAMHGSRLFQGRNIMDARTVARIGWTAAQRGKPLVIPGLWNWLLAFSIRLSPRRLVPFIVRRMVDPVQKPPR